jgi:hypothetical protein
VADLRSRLCEADASQHTNRGGEEAGLVYRRDIRLLPPAIRFVVDIGCSRSGLVRLPHVDGFDGQGINFIPEQAKLARTIVASWVTPRNFRTILAANPAHDAAITATDLLEQLTKAKVSQTSDEATAALGPGGVFMGRIPNAISTLGGHIRNGDLIHQLSFTTRIIRQPAGAAGFNSVLSQTSRSVRHGLTSATRTTVRQIQRTCCRITLTAETGMLCGHIVIKRLTFSPRKVVELASSAERNPA